MTIRNKGSNTSSTDRVTGSNKSSESAKRNDAFIRAARSGRLDLVKSFIAAGINLHTNGDLAIQLAAERGRTKVVRALLEAEPDVRQWTSGRSLNAAVGAGHGKVLDLLLRAGLDLHSDGDRLLIRAVASGRPDMVQTLLRAGADVQAGNNWALRLAVTAGSLAVAEVLLEAGADAHAIGSLEFTKAWERYYGLGPISPPKQKNEGIPKTVALVRRAQLRAGNGPTYPGPW